MVSQRRPIASDSSTSPAAGHQKQIVRVSLSTVGRRIAQNRATGLRAKFLPVISNERFLLDMLNLQRYPVRHRAGLTWMGTLDDN